MVTPTPVPAGWSLQLFKQGTNVMVKACTPASGGYYFILSPAPNFRPVVKAQEIRPSPAGQCRTDVHIGSLFGEAGLYTAILAAPGDRQILRIQFTVGGLTQAPTPTPAPTPVPTGWNLQLFKQGTNMMVKACTPASGGYYFILSPAPNNRVVVKAQEIRPSPTGQCRTDVHIGSLFGEAGSYVAILAAPGDKTVIKTFFTVVGLPQAPIQTPIPVVTPKPTPAPTPRPVITPTPVPTGWNLQLFKQGTNVMVKACAPASGGYYFIISPSPNFRPVVKAQEIRPSPTGLCRTDVHSGSLFGEAGLYTAIMAAPGDKQILKTSFTAGGLQQAPTPVITPKPPVITPKPATPVPAQRTVMCTWITGKGGAIRLKVTDLFELEDAYYGFKNIGFKPLIEEIMGAEDMVMGFVDSGKLKIKCKLI